jgi:hypothetical protein
MVGLIRDTCPAFKRDQRIRRKINVFSVFFVCSSDQREWAREIILISVGDDYSFLHRKSNPGNTYP